MGVDEPAQSVAVDGAEAEELVVSMRKPNDFAPLVRTYLAIVRPFSGSLLVSVSYSVTPGQFDAGSADARKLTRRLHFAVPPGTPIPAPPAVKPADAPPAPKKSDSPHTPLPPGAAGLG